MCVIKLVCLVPSCCRYIAAPHLQNLTQVSGLSTHPWHGDQAAVHDLTGKYTQTMTPTLKPQYVYDLKGKHSCSSWLQVRFGQQKRYQDWFQRQYLSTAESQSLRCDLIRYICGVVHPSNEVLSSDILPRWAIIGWLLTTCTVSKY